MSNSRNPCYGFLNAILVLLAICIPIASIVIGIQTKGSECDDESIINLSTWLIVYGIVTLTIIGCVVVMLGISLCCGCVGVMTESACPFGCVVSGNILIILLVIANTLWTIAWNIVGAISLFDHSMDCLNDVMKLWIMTLIVLIFQWISIIQTCCIGGGDTSDEDLRSRLLN